MKLCKIRATRLGVTGWVIKKDLSVIPGAEPPDTFNEKEYREARKVLGEFGYTVELVPVGAKINGTLVGATPPVGD